MKPEQKNNTFCQKCNEEFKSKFTHMIENDPNHWVRISSTFSVLRPFSYLRPFLYFDRYTSTSLLRPLYFDSCTSNSVLRIADFELFTSNSVLRLVYFDLFASTSVLRTLYFKLCTSTSVLRPFVKSGLLIGREAHVEVQVWSK